MHFDFRPLFRKTFAKIPLSADPSHQQGRIKGKAKARSLGVWLSQSLTFGSLAAAFGACFLRLQKATLGSTSGRCKEVLQDHGIWLTFGSFIYTMIMIHNIQLSRHFREGFQLRIKTPYKDLLIDCRHTYMHACITLHYIELHYIILHCIALHTHAHTHKNRFLQT